MSDYPVYLPPQNNVAYAPSPYPQYAHPAYSPYAPPAYAPSPYPQYAPPAYTPKASHAKVAPPAYYPKQQQLNKNLGHYVKSNGENKAVVVTNVEAPYDVNLACSSLKFKRGEPNSKGEIAFHFKGDGDAHSIKILNQMRPVREFSLTPRPAEVKFIKNGGSKFQIDNLYNPKQLKLASDNKLKWNLKAHPSKKNSYIVNFNAFDKVHNIKLTTSRNGKTVNLKNGTFKLAPKNRPQPKAVAAPAMAPAYYGPPPAYYGPPSAYYAPPPAYYQSPPPMYARN